MGKPAAEERARPRASRPRPSPRRTAHWGTKTRSPAWHRAGANGKYPRS